MSDIINPVNLGIAVMVFGFLPYPLALLAVRLYPRDDPRRHELLAELEHVPLFERPFRAADIAAHSVTTGLARRAQQNWYPNAREAVLCDTRRRRVVVRMMGVWLIVAPGGLAFDAARGHFDAAIAIEVGAASLIALGMALMLLLPAESLAELQSEADTRD